MESAQVMLMKSDPYDVVAAIEPSRATLRKMHAINALMLKRTKLAGICNPHPLPAAPSPAAQGASA
jgi:hypothetical protein